MNSPTIMNKDHLAAFVDGELSPEEAAAVVMHLADHPEDQIYVDDLMAANAALARAFSGPMSEPVPRALQELILGTSAEAPKSTVLPFRAKSAPRSRLAIWGGLAAGAALAAGLAVAVFLPAASPHYLVPGPLAAQGPIPDALNGLASGTTQATDEGAEVMIFATVPTPTGFCREIEVIDAAEGRLQAALACTEGSGWNVAVVVTERLNDAAEVEGFGTASGDTAQSFSPFLNRIGAGPSLSPEQEATAMAEGWKQ